MDAIRRTTISAGRMLYKVLSENQEISETVTKIFPVAADEADLPYIVYRRVEGEYDPVKQSIGADASIVEVLCCAEDYDTAVDLAELTRRVLDRSTAKEPDMVMRSCRYLKSDEYWEDDAYVVRMSFKVAIG